MRECYGSEDEVRGLNATGNPEVRPRTGGEGMDSVRGVIGQILPTGRLASGTPEKSLWGTRGGAARGTEKIRSHGRR